MCRPPRPSPGSTGGLAACRILVPMSRHILGWVLVGAQAVLLVALVLVPREDTNIARIALGALLMATGAVIGGVAGVRLGSALTPTPVPLAGSTLRTEGPYRTVRHPIYSAVLLAALGFAVAFGSGWTWLVVGLLALFFWGKSRWEDSLLKEAHGPEWELWQSTTGALVPRLPTRRGNRR